MFDRKLLYTLVSIGAVVMIAVTLSTLPKGNSGSPESGEAVSGVESGIAIAFGEAEETVEKTAKSYIVREHDGYIAVFLEGEAKPQLVLETQVKFLPDYDRVLMRQGIKVDSYEKLSALIEDYIS